MTILVYDIATGEMLADGLADAPAGFSPDLHGWRYEPIGYPERITWSAALPGFVDIPTISDLDVCRIEAARLIDEDAERVRCLYLTPGAGQAMTYSRKEAEAGAYLADGTEGPFLTAEAAARGMTIADLAAEVLAQVAAWVTIGAAIEARRMGAKAAVAAASTPEAIRAASAIDWHDLPA